MALLQIHQQHLSAVGLHDLGTNAERIRRLFAEITTALEKGEKTALEQVAPKEESEKQEAAKKKPAKKKTGRKKRATSR